MSSGEPIKLNVNFIRNTLRQAGKKEFLEELVYRVIAKWQYLLEKYPSTFRTQPPLAEEELFDNAVLDDTRINILFSPDLLACILRPKFPESRLSPLVFTLDRVVQYVRKGAPTFNPEAGRDVLLALEDQNMGQAMEIWLACPEHVYKSLTDAIKNLSDKFDTILPKKFIKKSVTYGKFVEQYTGGAPLQLSVKYKVNDFFYQTFANAKANYDRNYDMVTGTPAKRLEKQYALLRNLKTFVNSNYRKISPDEQILVCPQQFKNFPKLLRKLPAPSERGMNFVGGAPLGCAFYSKIVHDLVLYADPRSAFTVPSNLTDSDSD